MQVFICLLPWQHQAFYKAKTWFACSQYSNVSGKLQEKALFSLSNSQKHYCQSVEQPSYVDDWERKIGGVVYPFLYSSCSPKTTLSILTTVVVLPKLHVSILIVHLESQIWKCCTRIVNNKFCVGFFD